MKKPIPPKKSNTYESMDACIIDMCSKGMDKESASKMCEKMMGGMKPELSHVFSDVQFLSENFDPNAEFEILTSDKQYDSRYGSFQYTKADLEEIAKNFNDNVRGVEIAVDINHDREKKAYAWMEPKACRVGEATNLTGHYSLFCRLYRYTPEGLELMKTGAYRYFSVELMLKWETYKEGKKEIFKNVLFGLALTNSPVIKDMKPAYSESNENLSINFNKMELFKQYLSLLQGKKVVTKEEKEVLKSMLSKLSEDEQDKLEGEVDKVESKPEKEEESSEARAQRELAEKKALEASSKLTETEKELEKSNKRLSEVESKLKKNEYGDKANAYILSENVATGFVPKDKDAVVEFMLTLSEEQIVKFDALMKNVKSCKFGESGKAATEQELSEDAKEKEAEALADKILSENKGMEKWEAIDKAYDQLGLKK